MDMTPPGHPCWVQVPDDSLTDEAIAICLGYLYGELTGDSNPAIMW